MTTPLERILAALHYDGPRRSGNYACHCPAHDDQTASLSITEAQNGRVLLHCHAGCKPGHVLRALGMVYRDLLPDSLLQHSQRNGDRSKPQILATYDYRDAAGKLAYQIVRYHPKEFRQRRPDGRGDWIWNMRGVTRLPYRLPELLMTPPDVWVLLPEGEKDVDNLVALGFCATCNAQGAGKWEQGFNSYFAGRRVCLLPDNDEAGHNHARAIAHALEGIARDIRWLELPGLPPKGDVSDWLAAGGTRPQLISLVEAAPPPPGPAPVITELPPAAPGQPQLYSESGEEGGDPLLTLPYHDHGNATAVLFLHPKRFAFVPALGWLEHTGTHWEGENAEFSLNNAITDSLIRRRLAGVAAEREDLVRATAPNEARKNSVKGMLRDLVVMRLSDFDADPNLLNCANGVVDLRTGQLLTHEASGQFTYCVPVDFVPGASAELWINFLISSVENWEEVADWLQMSVGYSTTGITREECMFYVEGPSRSGKGAMMQTLLTLLGQPLARGVDFATFTKARDGDSQNFDLAVLRPARLVSASESGRYAALNEAVVKSITGNDPISAAFKHRDMFSFTPMFKVWLSSNHPAKGDVDDDAFWGRIRVLRLPHSHLGREDKTLKARLVQPENLMGVLAWAVEGARRWYVTPQGLITPKAVARATQSHRDQLDHVQMWLQECAVLDAAETVSNNMLYQSYSEWCAENGHPPKQAVAFGRALAAKGFEQAWKRVGAKAARAYRGLRLIQPPTGASSSSSAGTDTTGTDTTGTDAGEGK